MKHWDPRPVGPAASDQVWTSVQPADATVEMKDAAGSQAHMLHWTVMVAALLESVLFIGLETHAKHLNPPQFYINVPCVGGNNGGGAPKRVFPLIAA